MGSRVSGPAHFPALDGLRGLAIIAVLATHAFLMACVFQPRFAALASPASAAFYKTMELGWCGVDCFFVLSGFLITHGILANRRDPHLFRNFYARRALRLLPIYYVLLLVYFGLAPMKGVDGSGHAFNARHVTHFALFGQNLLELARGNPTGELGYLWSLGVEEQFYVLWPICAVLLGARWWWVPVSGLCLAPVLRALSLSVPDLSPHAVYVFTLTRLDGICVGALIAMAFANPARHAALRRWAGRLLPLAALALIAAIGGSGHYTGTVSLDSADSMYARSIQQVGYPALAVFFGSALALCITNPATAWLNRMLSFKLLRLYGTRSYGIYMFHTWVFGGLALGGLGLGAFQRCLGHTLAADVAYVAFYVAVGLVPGALSYALIEGPVLKLKRHFGASRPCSSVRAALEESGAEVLGHRHGAYAARTAVARDV